MAGRQLAARQHVAHFLGQPQQPQRVRDMAAALADDLRKVLLRIGKLLDQLAVALRLFQRIEVDALHVLDDRELERFLVVDLADDAPAPRAAPPSAPPASAARRR